MVSLGKEQMHFTYHQLRYLNGLWVEVSQDFVRGVRGSYFKRREMCRGEDGKVELIRVLQGQANIPLSRTSPPPCSK